MIDLDLAFKLTFAVGAAVTTYSSFGVVSIFAWQLLFVVVPTIYLTTLTQVKYTTLPSVVCSFCQIKADMNQLTCNVMLQIKVVDVATSSLVEVCLSAVILYFILLLRN